MRQIISGSGNSGIICVGGSVTINGDSISGNNIAIVNGKIVQDADVIHGNNKVVTSEIALPAYEALANYGISAKIVFHQGPLQPAKVTADENILPLIHVAVDPNGTNLSIKSTGNFSTTNPIKIELQSPLPLREVFSEGSGDTTLSYLDTDCLRIDLVGSGDVRASGKAKRLDVTVCGSGDVDAEDLTAEIAEVSVNGSGNVSVCAADQCQVRISGSGDVTVYGGPKQLSSEVRGSGKVRNR